LAVFGLRREAKRHAALVPSVPAKAVSPLRFRGAPKRASATAAATALQTPFLLSFTNQAIFLDPHSGIAIHE